MTEPGSRTPARRRRTRGWRARAAAVLGWGLLLFVGGQAALTAALEHRPGARDQGYSVRRARLRRRLAERPGRPLVLALGSSRIMFGFRPADLPPCGPPGGPEPLAFNCGIEGGGSLMDLIFLRRFLAEGVRPDWVILECWTATEDVGNFTPIARPQRLDWRDLSVFRRYSSDRGRLYREWAELRLLPGFTDRAMLLDKLGLRWRPPPRENYLEIDDGGWQPCPWGHTPTQRELAAKAARQSYWPVMQRYRHQARDERIVRDILALCGREGIGVVFVFLPEAPWFQDLYSPAARADLATYLGRMRREWGVPVINARDWIHDEDFADGFHLLPQGARAFTARFGEQVLRPLLAGRRPVAAEAPEPEAHSSP